ncbi:MAG TPA: folylpolyglutamate synthase/dihydrofolate synthase family protein [Saprospiraceae bacterium]|nr:folylpolyglutamate synthase/dihydrofolate synthase family protein [Saprospiraceae bacterium]
MKYNEALQYMYDALPMFHRQGQSAFKKDLTNIRLLCAALGNPHLKLKCIHIAGTNGKGSVSHMLASVLQANGYRTGLYVSPHYKDFRERIKIDGECIPKRIVSAFIENNRDLFARVQPSFFEMTVALAFYWFARQQVDYAVIETGLGGRLDSTNIVMPMLSIITNISWDHKDMLGDSLEKIAFAKAGIIKQDTPVLIGRRQKETQAVFATQAKELSAPLSYADEWMDELESKTDNLGIANIRIKIHGRHYKLKPALKGWYQLENIRTVMAALLLMEDRKQLKLTLKRNLYALEHVDQLSRIVGRWQALSQHPMVIAESAHNEDGIRFMVEQLKHTAYEQLHIVCGFVKDKPLDPVLGLLPKSAQYYFVKADMPRGLDAETLCRQAAAFDLHGQAYASVRKGLKAARQTATKTDLILVTGSIFVVGEIL